MGQLFTKDTEKDTEKDTNKIKRTHHVYLYEYLPDSTIQGCYETYILHPTTNVTVKDIRNAIWSKLPVRCRQNIDNYYWSLAQFKAPHKIVTDLNEPVVNRDVHLTQTRRTYQSTKKPIPVYTLDRELFEPQDGEFVVVIDEESYMFP